jgi:hypothetical protein
MLVGPSAIFESIALLTRMSSVNRLPITQKALSSLEIVTSPLADARRSDCRLSVAPVVLGTTLNQLFHVK